MNAKTLFLSNTVFLFAFLSIAIAADTDPDGAIFQSSEDPLADVEQAIGRAGNNDKLALIVMGANWCHDSRALGARLQRAPLHELIEEHYELVIVDVGFYEERRDLTEQFGVANYYATPTVLIVDPSTRRLINDSDRHIWGNAYRIDMASSVAYFEKWAKRDTGAEGAVDSAQLAALYSEIDKFEHEMAERVAVGYQVVGPMLAASDEGDEPADFDARWSELSGFRNAIPGDVQQLRDEAERRVSEGEEEIRLEFPEYAALSWELAD